MSYEGRPLAKGTETKCFDGIDEPANTYEGRPLAKGTETGTQRYERPESDLPMKVAP